MKTNKILYKLLSVTFTVFMMLCGSTPFSFANAMSCKGAVEYLCINSFFLKGGSEYRLFGQEYIRPGESWTAFIRNMSEKFGDVYTKNVDDIKDPQTLDSFNFLFLALNLYQEIYEKMSDEASARQATQMLHLMFRDFNEQANDKKVLQSLSEVYADFNGLKQVLI